MELERTISRMTDTPPKTVSQRARGARIVHAPRVQHYKNRKLALKPYLVPLRWMVKLPQNVYCHLGSEADIRMHLENVEGCPAEYRSVPPLICHLDRAKLLSEGISQELDQQSLN
eukprot:7647380-Pyramimonas_sp.AAC.1